MDISDRMISVPLETKSPSPTGLRYRRGCARRLFRRPAQLRLPLERLLGLLHRQQVLLQALRWLRPMQARQRKLVRKPALLLQSPRTGQPPGQRTNGYS
jgi:hypothetical protein